LLEAAAADRQHEQHVLAWSRLPWSQATNTVSHPSSLVRAVSSDTLSTGV
jgi:hypothetical protein